ncbi:MAG TPA: pyridoxal-dependent decarboxylase [Bryobacteraceae bacterium]|nr:pyridoxal-dependent decarboxylase [Bryobacteraceae bacterium]
MNRRDDRTVATANPFRKSLTAALEHALDFLEGLDARPVAPTAGLESLRSRLLRDLADQGTPADQVIAELVRDVEGGILGSTGGRFFAWVVGGVLPASLAADWLTATWDQNAGIHVSGPAAAVVEEVAGAWLKEILGLPAGASFAFVTGCQMAHVTCLAAARQELLERRGWDVARRGLYGAPPIRIVTSTERHGSIQRAVRLLGMGLDQMIDLPASDGGQLAPEPLRRELERVPEAPTVVLLQAGDLTRGAYDSFEDLIPIARQHGAWVHVDGAFGLWAAASPRYRHLVRGVEGADSWATDGHKWLNVPYDSGYAFVADPRAHVAAMSHREPYLQQHLEARDQMDWNPEWSRRARGFSTYAAIRELGRSGIARVVEQCCDRARSLVQGIGRLDGAEVIWEPTINQGLVRFLDRKPGAGEFDHDRRTDEVIARIVSGGEAYFGGTTWQGRRAMRVSVCNWRTSEDDVARVIEGVRRALAE